MYGDAIIFHGANNPFFGKWFFGLDWFIDLWHTLKGVWTVTCGLSFYYIIKFYQENKADELFRVASIFVILLLLLVRWILADYLITVWVI